jgi:hypothetical protein
MNALKCRFVVAILVAMGVASNANGASKDVQALLNLMPGDMPLAVVVPNAEELDALMAEAMKTLDSEAEAPGLVSALKSQVKVAAWVEFSKPLGIAQSDFSNDNTAMIFAVAPDFAEKIKTLKDAKKEDGLWVLPFDDGTMVFASQQGAYVIASKSKTALQAGLDSTTKLGTTMKSRLSLLDGKQILVEVNVEPVRAQALGGIMQLSMFAPMLVMSATADGSMDPGMITGMIAAGTEGLQKFVEQVAVVDIAIGIKGGAVNATIQPTFNDGVISKYLTAQKSGRDFFKGTRTDSYIGALSWKFPGDSSPLSDWFMDKMEVAAATPSPMGQPADGGDEKAAADAKLKSVKESLATWRKLYGVLDGMDGSFSSSPTGMIVTGHYAGGSPSKLLQLLVDSFAKSDAISNMFGGGMKYEESGSRKIGSVEVKEYAMTADPNNAQAAQAMAIYGENPRFTMGVVGDRVRFCVGPDGSANKYFNGPFGGAVDAGIAGMMKHLPTRKNIVMAFNPAGIMGMVAMMSGGGASATPVAGPPIGLSISLSGEARLDLHVPLAAIKPLMGAGGDDGGPM